MIIVRSLMLANDIPMTLKIRNSHEIKSNLAGQLTVQIIDILINV